MKDALAIRAGESKQDYTMKFDSGTIRHLGIQMYSTLPPVIGELVANAWDADATRVEITIPVGPVSDQSEIVVKDNGNGMSDEQVRRAYLVIGRDKRIADGTDRTPRLGRRVMGRKGIGKLSGFGIANEIEIESYQHGEVSRFQMNLDEFRKSEAQREISMPPLPPTGNVGEGTMVTLRYLTKYRTRSISIPQLRRGLARRFAVIGNAAPLQGGEPVQGAADDDQLSAERKTFDVVVNGEPITVAERDLKTLLEFDTSNKLYLWEYDDIEVKAETGWTVSGWIGALDRKTTLPDGVQHGIAIMARGKLVQEPFVFDAVVGQQYALSYLLGELHAEFVDAGEDTIGTSRNALVWDTEANAALKQWGQKEVNKIAREWAEKRANDNEVALSKNALYLRFEAEAAKIGNSRAKKIADKLIREVVKRNPIADEVTQGPIVQMCLDFLEFDAFWDLAQDLVDVNPAETDKLIGLFREWEVVEAKEMMRVTEGRIATIEKLQQLIDTNALEVPTLHAFLKEFPWVLDPRWALIADEKRYSTLLREKFPDDVEPENDRRIDFLCVSEGTQIVVVEIKRPQSRASKKELDQVEGYVGFMRDYIERTTDPDLRHKEVTGYLLCGDLVDTWEVRQRRGVLDRSNIYVRRYADLLSMVKKSHKEFLERYEQLRTAKGGR